MTQLVLLVALLGADKPATDPPRLAERQVTQIQDLIRETRGQDTKLKEQLVARQRRLIAAYTNFQLDERRIERLQAEVIDLQRQLLNNYHRLQTGLRRIAGRERFKKIKSRVDVYFRSRRGPADLVTPPSGAEDAASRKN